MNTNNTNVIAIDGHAGAGKGSVSKRVAEALGMRALDTGIFYRSVAYLYHEGDTDLSRITTCDGQIFIDGNPVTESMIRTEAIDKMTPQIAQEDFVRSAVNELIRASVTLAGIVVDGRDIGTVVFPNAMLKIFLTASAEVRAKRIMDDPKRKKSEDTFEKVLANVQLRDHLDETRTQAPLIKASDAILIDTSGLYEEEVAEEIVYLWRQKESQQLSV